MGNGQSFKPALGFVRTYRNVLIKKSRFDVRSSGFFHENTEGVVVVEILWRLQNC